MTSKDHSIASLLVHDERYSKLDLILNPDLIKGVSLQVGDLVQIELLDEKSSFTLQITGFIENNSIQISIAQHIASLFNIPPRSMVKVTKVFDLDSVSCSVIEICFRDQYIGRRDMWNLQMSLASTAVYVGKKIFSLGIRGQVKGIYINGKAQNSGFVREDTRTVFRSESAKFFIFIQMSKEMWHFDEDGEMYLEKCIYGFLPELFERWKNAGSNHVVSIVCFARVIYPNGAVTEVFSNASTSDGEEAPLFHRDMKNRPCRDFYRVVVDRENNSDWNSVIVALKHEFVKFQKEILEQRDKSGETVLSGSNSTASQGNLLEALNLALNPFDKHYIDRDLLRTGLSIVAITPSTGFYEVDKSLCRLTTQRMIDSGISLDLVCLSPPPLHSVPLFQFYSRESVMKQANSIPVQKINSYDTGVSSTAPILGAADTFDFLYLDDTYFDNGQPVQVFLIPDWVDCSYWTRKQRLSSISSQKAAACSHSPNTFNPSEYNDDEFANDFLMNDGPFVPRSKCYELQMGVIDSETSIDIPYLDIFDSMNDSVDLPLTVSFSQSLRDPSVLCMEYDQSIFPAGALSRTSWVGNSSGFSLPLETTTRSLGSGGKPRNSLGKSAGSNSVTDESRSPEQTRTSYSLISTSYNEDCLRRQRQPRNTESHLYGSFSEKWSRDIGGIRIRSTDGPFEKIDGERSPGGGYSSSIEPIRIRYKGGKEHEQRLLSVSPPLEFTSPANIGLRGPLNKFSPSKTPAKKMHLLRHKYVNPYQTIQKYQLGTSDRRWEHNYPKWVSHRGNELYTNWRSLVTPACLPLTIEYFPTPEELSEFFLEYTYTVSPAYEETTNRVPLNAEYAHRKIESLLVELISQRLSQGFQLIVPGVTTSESKQIIPSSKIITKTSILTAALQPPTTVATDYNLMENGKQQRTASANSRGLSISEPYFLSLGDHVHRLFYDASGNNVEVKRYTRRLNYNSSPIRYSCSIWQKNIAKYQPHVASFHYPALTSYNWNYLDHLISGYQDQMTDALRFWRIRFLLIPLETAPSSTNSDGDKLNEEEERIAGFQKFIETVEKARFIPPEEKKKNTKAAQKRVLDIQLTTLNLSSLVASVEMHSLLPEAFLVNNNSENTGKIVESLSRRSPLDVVGKAICQPPPSGVLFQSRHWHFRVYSNVATGEELIDWIIQNFLDVETREVALEVGNMLIDGGIIEHAKQTHKQLIDGFYFYRLCPRWVSLTNSAKGQSEKATKRFQAVKQMRLDLDLLKKSTRQEVSILHYDTTHNTENCYHFQLHWLVCTPRLIEDMMHAWTRMADKCGFKLVEAPGEQAMVSGKDDPFEAVILIKLSIPPPPVEGITAGTSNPIKLASDWFENELVKSFNFVLDTESDSCFPLNSRGYSYQRKPWPYTQYVHRSGSAFIQILPKQEGFYWVQNRLLLASSVSRTISVTTTQPVISPDQLREGFQAFCGDPESLSRYWQELKIKLDTYLKKSLLSQSDPKLL